MPGKLVNAVSDAEAVYAALSALPGAQATLIKDCGKAEMEKAIKDFRDSSGVCLGRGMNVTSTMPLGPKVLGIIFFAGHGLQVGGKNYLVPADFNMPRRNDRLDVMLADTAGGCVSLDDIEARFEEASVTAGSILLDCCRDVPDFLAELGATRSAGSRSLSRGMGEAAPKLPDLMITFATAPGSVALDRSTLMPSHSPFTAALLSVLARPGVSLLHLNPLLTDLVQSDSGGRQRPHVGGSYGMEAGSLTLLAPAYTTGSIPSTGSSHSVMISYRVPETGSGGDSSVFALKVALERRGFSVFVGESAIEGGSSWPVTIQRGVEQCSAFVVLCSPTYGDPLPNGRESWTLREIVHADNLSKPLLPVWHSGPYPPNSVAMYLGSRQRIPAGDYRDGYVLAGISHTRVAEELAAALMKAGVQPMR